MLPYHRKLLAGIGGRYQARAVTFDGTNDYLTRGGDFTGNADGKLGIVSFWVKINNNQTNVFYDNGATGQQYFFCDAGGAFQLEFENSGGTNTLAINSAGGLFLAANGWKHVLASWDVGNGLARLFVDDVEQSNAGFITNNNTIDYTDSSHFVCADTGSGNRLNGDIADFYFNNAEYIDLSIEANRRKFISSAGKPVYLGNNGELPTGTSPRLFLSLAQGAAVSTFATNKGTGGGMTITGTLAEAATSPSD